MPSITYFSYVNRMAFEEKDKKLKICLYCFPTYNHQYGTRSAQAISVKKFTIAMLLRMNIQQMKMNAKTTNPTIVLTYFCTAWLFDRFNFVALSWLPEKRTWSRCEELGREYNCHDSQEGSKVLQIQGTRIFSLTQSAGTLDLHRSKRIDKEADHYGDPSIYALLSWSMVEWFAFVAISVSLLVILIVSKLQNHIFQYMNVWQWQQVPRPLIDTCTCTEKHKFGPSVLIVTRRGNANSRKKQSPPLTTTIMGKSKDRRNDQFLVNPLTPVGILCPGGIE